MKKTSPELEKEIRHIIRRENDLIMGRFDRPQGIVIVGIPREKHPSYGQTECFIWKQKNGREMGVWEGSPIPDWLNADTMLEQHVPFISEDIFSPEEIDQALEFMEER